MMMKSRKYTAKEVRNIIKNHMKEIVDFWADDTPDRTIKEKISGAIFSVLAMIDGDSINIPHINLVLDPHPENKDYHIENNENWYEKGMIINNDCALHEFWHDEEI